MFISLKVSDNKGKQWYEVINPFHISRLKLYDVKNLDAGTIVVMRSGDEFYTSEYIDQVVLKVDASIKNLTAAAILQIVSENLIIEQPKKPIRKTTTRTKRKV